VWDVAGQRGTPVDDVAAGLTEGWKSHSCQRMKMVTRKIEREKGVCVCVGVEEGYHLCVGRSGLFVLCRKLCGLACQIAPGILACHQCLKLSGYSAHFLPTGISCTVLLATALSVASDCGNGSWRRRRWSARDIARREAATCTKSAVVISQGIATPFGHARGYLPLLDAPVAADWRARRWTSG
jgi:hypothetical protein